MTLVDAIQRSHRPEEMSGRAQLYLLASAGRHLLTGGWMLLVPERFMNLDAALGGHLTLWGASFLFVALLSIAAATSRNEHVAQLALFLSAVATGALAWRILGVWADDGIPSVRGKTSPLLWIFAGSLTVKDLIVCRQPLRAPFEPLRQWAREARRRRTATGGTCG